MGMTMTLAQGGGSQEMHKPHETALDFLSSGGELGGRMRDLDWSGTPLGPPCQWPHSLKTAVRIMLASQQPFWIGWGKELTYLYNDAYKAIIGGKHPWALGRPTSEVWREIWNEIGPMLDAALRGGEGTYVEAKLLFMERYGYREETYSTFSYSPIPNDDGSVGGIICANTDDTRRVIGERQLALLGELAASTANARTWHAACQRSAQALASNSRDLPFALIYGVEPENNTLMLAGICGIGSDQAAAPQTIQLDRPSPWPAADVLRTHEMRLCDIQALFGSDLPKGVWDAPPTQAAVLPVHPSGETGRAGVLIVGLNPFRRYDDSYRQFLALVASQIGSAIANAQTYEAERQRAEALAQIDRAKTAFFSNVSHEFRTPLTLMLGSIQDLLADATAPVRTRERLDLAHRNALRLQKLVNSLLDFSRIEAGRVHASFEAVDLAVLTRDLASTFRSLIERAGLTFAVECPALSEPVYVDRDMWEKIVLNLLSNAFKFTLSGRIDVKLYSTQLRAVLEIRDTGVGVPSSELPRLFERFYRVEGTQGRTHEGSGIGLALVQELVKLHGGTIEADSQLGRGTRFRVEVRLGCAHLPAEQIKAPRSLYSKATAPEAYIQEALRWLPDASPHISSPPDGIEKQDLGLDPRLAETSGARILLADDNADMRAYLHGLLSRHYAVEAVSDGEQALAAALRDRPDLLISDVMMPRLDGFEMVQKLRADDALRDIPVILLSARAGEESRIEGLQSGADDYLVKPFSARELLARVGASLMLARVRQEAAEALRASEERLAVQNAAIAHANRIATIGQLTASIAHEVNQPIGAARNNAAAALRFLSENPPDLEELREALGCIVKDTDRAGNIVHRIRALVKKEPPQVTRFAINDAINELIALARSVVVGNGVTIRLRLAERLSPVRGDRVQLQQVVLNLILNAVEAMSSIDDEPRELSISTEPTGADEVLVAVRDSGPGIDPQDLERVFDSFYTTKPSGTGLGLSICRSIVDAHGGRLWAGPNEPGGVVFQFTLPTANEDREVSGGLRPSTALGTQPAGSISSNGL
jgi:signal transduction histidine kinase